MKTSVVVFAHYSSDAIVMHVNRRLWRIGIDIGKQLGLDKKSRILDLGCGDGALANILLSQHYQTVEGFDLSVPAIQRANKLAPRSEVRFTAADITQMDYAKLPQYDGAYLWGILHHVKDATPTILQKLRTVTKRIVILEPNGNNIVRKILERTPTYRAAGEESFRTREMEQLFKVAGFTPVVWRRVNLFPNFTPAAIFNFLKPIEPFVEQTPFLRAICTVNMWGFIANDA